MNKYYNKYNKYISKISLYNEYNKQIGGFNIGKKIKKLFNFNRSKKSDKLKREIGNRNLIEQYKLSDKSIDQSDDQSSDQSSDQSDDQLDDQSDDQSSVDESTDEILDNPNINNFFVEQRMELYNYNTGISAGYADDIWPLITNYYNQNITIGVRQKDKNSLNPYNYKIIPIENIEKKYIITKYGKELVNINQTPLFAKGTFTAIYRLENLRNKFDKTKYILRIYNRNIELYMRDNIPSMHLLNTPKIKKEYELFSKYLIKIYHYGSIMINDDIYDYIITHEYNRTIDNLTNKERYTLLCNNIIMLNDLYKHKLFHADYKLANIGWDDNYNIILIDYDYGTIQEASKYNKQFNLDKKGRVKGYQFSTTHPLDLLKVNRNDPGVPKYRIKPKYYDKFSLGGLAYLIYYLNIKPNIRKYRLDRNGESVIKIPSNLIANQEIEIIYISNTDPSIFPNSLNLFDENYDKLPTYDDLLKILFYIANKKFIKNIQGGIQVDK